VSGGAGAAEFSFGNGGLISTGAADFVRLWDPNTGKLIKKEKDPEPLRKAQRKFYLHHPHSDAEWTGSYREGLLLLRRHRSPAATASKPRIGLPPGVKDENRRHSARKIRALQPAWAVRQAGLIGTFAKVPPPAPTRAERGQKGESFSCNPKKGAL
jgi:hypothetical protein